MTNDRHTATARLEKESDSPAAGQLSMRNDAGEVPPVKKKKTPYRRYQPGCKKYRKVQNG